MEVLALPECTHVLLVYEYTTESWVPLEACMYHTSASNQNDWMAYCVHMFYLLFFQKLQGNVTLADKSFLLR